MAEGARLESVYRRKSIAGSNPALSARTFDFNCQRLMASIETGRAEFREIRHLVGPDPRVNAPCQTSLPIMTAFTMRFLRHVLKR